MLGRRGAIAILCFVILYKFGDALARTMSNPLYVTLGFTKVEVANIGKAYGFVANLAGLAEEAWSCCGSEYSGRSSSAASCRCCRT